ncbi:hypothetical protein B0T16DRAFT_384271 [Cercophora newfieldiana]|uniref:Uncharacterized protein n=1 Tax=Cercophora newfieldiana TaxID=92897 RepID=A0AA39YMP9_9PEZI|nr:hypothetical protein B0T16DRAFT_384271 [Cercophora newfieldiana]
MHLPSLLLPLLSLATTLVTADSMASYTECWPGTCMSHRAQAINADSGCRPGAPGMIDFVSITPLVHGGDIFSMRDKRRGVLCMRRGLVNTTTELFIKYAQVIVGSPSSRSGRRCLAASAPVTMIGVVSSSPWWLVSVAAASMAAFMTSSLLSLLAALAVARDEILDSIVASQNILRFLFRLDNLPIGQAITDDLETRCYDELLKLKAGGGPGAVLACGVLHNVFSSLQWLDHSPGKQGACDAILVPSLSQALEQLSPTGGKTNGHGASSHSGIVQVALEMLASIGTDLQNTLEKGNRFQVGPGNKTEEGWGGIEDDPEGSPSQRIYENYKLPDGGYGFNLLATWPAVLKPVGISHTSELLAGLPAGARCGPPHDFKGTGSPAQRTSRS